MAIQMQKTLRYIFNSGFKAVFALAFLIATAIFSHRAQSQSRFIPNGVRVGANVIPLVSTALNDGVSHYEITGDIDFHKYLLTLDLGRARKQRSGDNFRFLTSGAYFKAGIDVNFIENVPGSHVLGLGFRYAQSRFNNEFDRTNTSDIWGDREINLANNGVTTRWFEGLGILKVDVWHHVQLGFSLAYQFSKKTKGAKDFSPYDIPGYGLSEAATLWRFNYHVYYYIPFKKEKAE